MGSIAPDREWLLIVIAVVFGGQALYFVVSKTYLKTSLLGLRTVARVENPLEHTLVTTAFGLTGVAALLIWAFR